MKFRNSLAADKMAAFDAWKWNIWAYQCTATPTRLHNVYSKDSVQPVAVELQPHSLVRVFTHSPHEGAVGTWLSNEDLAKTHIRLHEGADLIFSGLGFTAHQDYFTHFEPHQTLDGAKTGDPEEKHLTTRKLKTSVLNHSPTGATQADPSLQFVQMSFCRFWCKPAYFQW